MRRRVGILRGQAGILWKAAHTAAKVLLMLRLRSLATAIRFWRNGGLRCCWIRAVRKFGCSCPDYRPEQYRLTTTQEDLLLSRCADRPLLSIVVPVYRTEPIWLEKCIQSVRQQRYGRWELLLVDNASERPALREVMERAASSDARVHLRFLDRNVGISQATNAGIEMARGKYVGFLDHDDELSPDALTWVVWALNRHPEALWVYSDEDFITPQGEYRNPHLKPDFSPYLLLGAMYICHFSLCDLSVVRAAGGLRKGFDGAQDHDLALRISERVRREQFVHIPRVLYHWRQCKNSMALSSSAKPYAAPAGRRAVAAALERRHLTGRVTSHPVCAGVYGLDLAPRRFPKVSIIIPTHNRCEVLKNCIASMRSHTQYPQYEIVVSDNCSNEPALADYLARESAAGRVRVIRHDKPLNPSEQNNLAVQTVDSEFVVLANHDIEITSQGWIEQLVAVADMDEAIAAVGALLQYPDGRVWHAGIILGLNGTIGHAHRDWPAMEAGYSGRLHSLQEFSAVTAALVLFRQAAFLAAGGFNAQRYPATYNDVDLCLRLRQRGMICIYAPAVKAVVHLEGASRALEYAEELKYRHRFFQDYGHLLESDPFFNRNLALSNEQFMGYRPFPVEAQVPELGGATEPIRFSAMSREIEAVRS